MFSTFKWIHGCLFVLGFLADPLPVGLRNFPAFLATVNRMGREDVALDPVGRLLVDVIARRPGQTLEIGSGKLGLFTRAVLETGSLVWVNEMSAQQRRGFQDYLPADLQQRVRYLSGRFPDTFQRAPYEPTFSYIFSSRVVHFLSPAGLRRFAETAYEVAAPGAVLVVTAATPYVFPDFAQVYEWRTARGWRDPGIIKIAKYLPRERARSYPPTLNLLVPETLARPFVEAGWKLEREENAFFYAEPSWRRDNVQTGGRERVALIVVKPDPSRPREEPVFYLPPERRSTWNRAPEVPFDSTHMLPP